MSHSPFPLSPASCRRSAIHVYHAIDTDTHSPQSFSFPCHHTLTPALSSHSRTSYSDHTQVTLRSHSGHTQVTLSSHSGHTQVTLRSHSGHTQVILICLAYSSALLFELFIASLIT